MNLFKTLAGRIPVASIATDLIDQIEDHETDLRIGKLEANVAAFEALKVAEQAAPKTPPPFHDWSIAAGEYVRRTIDLLVIYDSGFHANSESAESYIMPLVMAAFFRITKFSHVKRRWRWHAKLRPTNAGA